MDKFIYVFSTTDRDILLSRGFSLVVEKPYEGLYVFENAPDTSFSLDDVDYSLSDILTF